MLGDGFSGPTGPGKRAAGTEADLPLPEHGHAAEWKLSAPGADAAAGAGTLRGNDAVRQMASWKEMAQWLLEYDNYDFLKPTEISRMWTQIVQVGLPHVALACHTAASSHLEHAAVAAGATHAVGTRGHHSSAR